jgi:CheY-like chemotaxis protein
MTMILIVDDHHETGAVLARLLKTCGYDAIAVTSGKAALSLLPKVRPSLVILDKSMPELSGLDVLRAIRSDATLASVPVILYSAEDHPADVVEAKRLGAQEYLVKGITSWDVICSTVRRYAV